MKKYVYNSMSHVKNGDTKILRRLVTIVLKKTRGDRVTNVTTPSFVPALTYENKLQQMANLLRSLVTISSAACDHCQVSV